MKVKELIELLQAKNPEFEVIMSKDGEGNGYSPLSNLSDEMYQADSTWSGEVVCKEDCEEDFEYEANAIVLRPTN